MAKTVEIWRDHTRSIEERVKNLIARFTPEERVMQLNSKAPGIERLGIEKFAWNGECVHGLCNSGRATQFPIALGMAATFDPGLVEKIATAISDEARAKFHSPDWHGQPFVALMFCTPVINILRDPRWGRAMETYGEDPLLTGLIGAAFVRGLQGKDPNYLKTAACAKHLGVHSGPDHLRQQFDAVVSRKDLAETYMPAFGDLAREGVATVMATYNRVNGEHCCGSSVMLEEFLRGKYGFEGMVLSDQGALDSVHKTHQVTNNAVETAALCLNRGCDMEISGINAKDRAAKTVYAHVPEAIAKGLLSEEVITQALERIFAVRFRLGEFDPPKANPYASISTDVIQSPKHLRLARSAAEKSVVLVKNNGILPFNKNIKSMMVTGPNAADIQVLLGNFYRGVSGDCRTIMEGIVATAPEGTAIVHQQGCFLVHPNLYKSDWTAGLTEICLDAAVVVMGTSPLMEGEQGECIGTPNGGDRADLTIPENQLEFLRFMKSHGQKPLVVVVTGGSAMELEEVHKIADAVLIAWYPGEQGGMAVGDVLFGNVAPSGKLPVTFPKKEADLPEYTDYNMAGRTYRYLNKEPMYPFGFGLSYTTFTYSDCTLSADTVASGKNLTAKVTVTNDGDVAAEEVVQLYLKDHKASVPVPHHALKAFKRIKLKPGESKQVRFTITPKMMAIINEEGEETLEPGRFTVFIGGSGPDRRSQKLGASIPASADFRME